MPGSKRARCAAYLSVCSVFGTYACKDDDTGSNEQPTQGSDAGGADAGPSKPPAKKGAWSMTGGDAPRATS
jgi:hypothetical protein